MPLLEEIREGAVDTSTDLAQVLRRCMILAYRLGHEPFHEWVNQELNGYNGRDKIPDYRIAPAGIKVNAANSRFRVTNQAVHAGFFPVELHDAAQYFYCTQGVAELETLQDRDNIRFSLPAAVYGYIVNHLIDDNFGLTGAHHEVSPMVVRRVLSAVRNRIVEFTLSIEAEGRNIDEAAVGSSPIPTEKVDQKFQVIIMGKGHAINLGGGSSLVQNIEQQVVAGDVESLKRYLRGQGVGEEDLAELDEVLDGSTVEDVDNEQNRLRRWADKVASKASQGASELAKTATREAILLTVRYYFGEATN